MAVTRQRFEVFRFPVMQSTFCFSSNQAVVKICQLLISELSTVIDSTNQILITIPAATLINYFRPEGAVESVFIGEKRLNSASVSENNLRIILGISLRV